VDTTDLERRLEALRAQLRQVTGTKNRLERQMDTLDVSDPYYERKILDLQRRYDEQYGRIEEIEVQIEEIQSQIRSIRQEKISGDNIYQLLLAFDEVYHSATEAEQKEFMRAFIEKIEIYPEKPKDGCWVKKIVFNFPVPVNGGEVEELPLEFKSTVETVVLLRRQEGDELALTTADRKPESEIKTTGRKHYGSKTNKRNDSRQGN
jgi:site-specific DNA recombinase